MNDKFTNIHICTDVNGVFAPITNEVRKYAILRTTKSPIVNAVHKYFPNLTLSVITDFRFAKRAGKSTRSRYSTIFFVN